MKSHQKKIRKIEADVTRPKPSGNQMIYISPSNMATRSTPDWMRSLQAVAEIEESKRYRGASMNDNGQDLCMGVLALDPEDGFPRRMAIILDSDGPTHDIKPCPNNSLKTSLYCSDCKKVNPTT